MTLTQIAVPIRWGKHFRNLFKMYVKTQDKQSLFYWLFSINVYLRKYNIKLNNEVRGMLATGNTLKHPGETWWGFSSLWAFPRPLIPGVCDSTVIGVESQVFWMTGHGWGRDVSGGGIWLDLGRAVIVLSVRMLWSMGGFLCCSAHMQMFAPHTWSSECPARPWGRQDLWRTMQGLDKRVQKQQTSSVESSHHVYILLFSSPHLPAGGFCRCSDLLLSRSSLVCTCWPELGWGWGTGHSCWCHCSRVCQPFLYSPRL